MSGEKFIENLIDKCDEILSENQTLSITIKQLQKIEKSSTFAEENKKLYALLVLMNNLRHLKITQNKSQSKKSIDFKNFLKIESLELNYVCLQHVNLQNIYNKLIEFVCLNCKQSKIDDIFFVIKDNWKKLKRFSYKYCLMESISDDILTKIRYIEHLDLSFNKINEFSTTVNLPKLKYLNLSYNRLTKIPLFGQNFSNCLQSLILKCNRISNLENLHFFYYLWELNLEMNIINDVNNLKELCTLSALQRLQLIDNPISYKQDYRKIVLGFLSKNVHEFNFLFDNEKLTKNDIKLLGRQQFDFDFSKNNPNIVVVINIRNSQNTRTTLNRGKFQNKIIIDVDDGDDIEILQKSVNYDNNYNFPKSSTPISSELLQFESDLINGKLPDLFAKIIPKNTNNNNTNNNTNNNNNIKPEVVNDTNNDSNKFNEDVMNESIKSISSIASEKVIEKSESSDTYNEFATINHHLKIYFHFTLFESSDEDLVWYLNGILVHRNLNQMKCDREDILFDGILVLTTHKLYVVKICDRKFNVNDVKCYQNIDITTILNKVHSVTINRLQSIGCLPWKQGIYIDIKRNQVFENETYCLCITEDFYVTNDFISYLFYKKCLPDNCKIIFETNDRLKMHMNILMKANEFEHKDLRLLTTITLFTMNTDPNEYYLVTLLITDKDLFIVLNHNEQIILKQNEPIFPSDFVILNQKSIRQISDKFVDTNNKNFLILNFSDFTEWRFTIKNFKSMDWILSNLDSFSIVES